MADHLTGADMEDRVILVDTADMEIGTEEKLHAHQLGLLHRAFSIFVFGSDGSLLLQRRAREKYHSGGLWSNTCCSHPRPGESVRNAARRRLREEMGFDCELRGLLQFTYWAEFANGLIEHELDHVLFGTWDGVPSPDPREVEDWRWYPAGQLKETLQEHSHDFTVWLSIAWHEILSNRGTPPLARCRASSSPF
jgi:isopentenyl-diphosphate delta-isomerase